MTPVSKTYFDVLDDIVNKYNNTVYRTIKMKRIYVTSDSYVEYKRQNRTVKCYTNVFWSTCLEYCQ